MKRNGTALNVFLWLYNVCFVVSLSISISKTVELSLKTAGNLLSRQKAGSIVFYFRRFMIAINIFNASIWILLFPFPSLSTSNQFVLMGIIVALGNIGYSGLAATFIFSTKTISNQLLPDDQPILMSNKHGFGLNNNQQLERLEIVKQFSKSGAVVMKMALFHAIITIIFFIFLFVGLEALISIWICWFQCYYCLVVIIRLRFIKIDGKTQPINIPQILSPPS